MMIHKLTLPLLGASALGLLLSATAPDASARDAEPLLLAQAAVVSDLSAFLPEGVTLETASDAELDAAFSAAIAGLSDAEVIALVEQLSAMAPARAAQIARSAANARPAAAVQIAAAAARGAPGQAAMIVAMVTAVVPDAAASVVQAVAAAVPSADVEVLQAAADQGVSGIPGYADASDDPVQALPFFDEQAASFEPPPEDEREPVSPTQL